MQTSSSFISPTKHNRSGIDSSSGIPSLSHDGSQSRVIRQSLVVRYLFRSFMLVLMTLMVMEATSRLVFAVPALRLFIRIPDQIQSEQTEVLGMQDVADTLVSKYGPSVIHPYVGFVQDPNIDPRVNDYGFFGISPISERSSDIVTVAVTGGSVANTLLTEHSRHFTDELQSIPEFRDREIRLVNLAIPGFKQPQQLLTMSYFLSLGAEWDLLINLDGYNEIELPIMENLPARVYPSYPRAWHFFSQNSFNPTTQGKLAEVHAIRQKQQSVASFLDSPPARILSMLRLIGTVYGYRLDKRGRYLNYELVQQERSRQQTFQSTGPVYRDSLENTLALAVRIWRSSSVQMNSLANSNQMRYYHFLQPNQYVRNSKPFTNEEVEKFRVVGNDFATFIGDGYDELRSNKEFLVANGVDITDLTQIFRDTRDTVYIDDCCHMNAEGYRIMITAIVQTIRENFAGDILRVE